MNVGYFYLSIQSALHTFSKNYICFIYQIAQFKGRDPASYELSSFVQQTFIEWLLCAVSVPDKA